MLLVGQGHTVAPTAHGYVKGVTDRLVQQREVASSDNVAVLQRWFLPFILGRFLRSRHVFVSKYYL